MAFRIITADERLSAAENKTSLAIFGPPGVGKTTLLKTLPAEETVCLDLEAGMKSVQDWRGASIPVRSFADFRDLVVLIGGPDPAQHPQSWYGTERHAWLQAQHRDNGIEAFLAARRIVFVDSITDLTRQAMAYARQQPEAFFGSDRFRLAVSADGSTFFDGLSVDNANGIVDQPRLPRFKAYTNYDNYVGVGTWTKIGLNNTDYNDHGAFDAANNRFVAPVDGTYLFGATLLYKVNASTTARMRGRLVLNGATEIRGSLGEISATHVSLATAIWLQTMVPLTAGDTVELQGYFRVADGYFAADHTSFWGAKVG